MKFLAALCTLIASILTAKSALANPIVVGGIYDLFQRKQNVCIVLQGYFSSGPYRLDRTMGDETTRIRDDWDILAEKPLADCADYDVYVTEDVCVPVGEATYSLSSRIPSGWVNEGSESISVADSGEECGADDDCAALVDLDEFLPCPSNDEEESGESDGGCGC